MMDEFLFLAPPAPIQIIGLRLSLCQAHPCVYTRPYRQPAALAAPSVLRD